ncbi:MAG: KpsF/GutQ family sugar-phosphate isomerase [Sedimentisphaerales bacterium]|nr:KpsF/GutQ family sugar-phosphate isomerase [Sedimentisphaerales bacterium]
MTSQQPETLKAAQKIIQLEAQALQKLADHLDNSFCDAAQMIFNCTGAVVVSGVGKAGIVGQKISATLASTGTPSHFLHPSEAIHGDLGRLRDQDIVIVLSHSGTSEEIVRLIELLKRLGIPMIALTGGNDSPLAQYSNVTVSLGQLEEVCPLGLAPSTSTTCMLALGDALALTVMQMRNFQAEDYARFHPGGALGRKLVTVEQASLFTHDQNLPTASDAGTIQQALDEAEAKTKLRHGCILLIDSQGKLTGLLTDGDLRRAVRQKGSNILNTPVADLMTKNPTVVKPDTLASEAMDIFHKRRIDEIPVVNNQNKPVGIIDVQDVLALKVIQ